MKKFLSLPEEATNKPNYNKRFGLNQSNSKIKNNLTDCLMRFLFFSRATFFRRCLQRAVLVVFLFFITPLMSCIDSEGNIYYGVKVSAQDFITPDTLVWDIYNDDGDVFFALRDKPLHIIKKAVEGKWKVHKYNTDKGIATYTNTFANITKDSVIITKGEVVNGTDVLPSSFSYRWEIKTIWLSDPFDPTKKIPHSYYVIVSEDDETVKWSFFRMIKYKHGTIVLENYNTWDLIMFQFYKEDGG